MQLVPVSAISRFWATYFSATLHIYDKNLVAYFLTQLCIQETRCQSHLIMCNSSNKTKCRISSVYNFYSTVVKKIALKTTHNS